MSLRVELRVVVVLFAMLVAGRLLEVPTARLLGA